jgi:hypothetical protein
MKVAGSDLALVETKLYDAARDKASELIETAGKKRTHVNPDQPK